jgi:hypothetical protein
MSHGAVTQANAVRKSEAPRAPPHAFDVVFSDGKRVYTLCPPSHTEQLQWVCAISDAMRSCESRANPPPTEEDDEPVLAPAAEPSTPATPEPTAVVTPTAKPAAGASVSFADTPAPAAPAPAAKPRVPLAQAKTPTAAPSIASPAAVPASPAPPAPSPSVSSRSISSSSVAGHEMVLAPADGSAALHSEPSGVARALSKQLDHGKLVVLRHDPKSTAATQLDAS